MNIDHVLRAAHSASAGWSPERAQKLVLAARPPDSTIDWDAAAGEAWIRVLRASDVLAYVSVDIPIVISIADAFDPESVQHVLVANLGTTNLAATRSVLAECFGDSPRLDGLDVNSFSADDLWYATV
jgi:uncharacterized protein (DUF2336 family)